MDTRLLAVPVRAPCSNAVRRDNNYASHNRLRPLRRGFRLPWVPVSRPFVPRLAPHPFAGSRVAFDIAIASLAGGQGSAPAVADTVQARSRSRVLRQRIAPVGTMLRSLVFFASE